jgi:hypothetical protein
MANNVQTNMVITVNVNNGRISKVEKVVTGEVPQEISPESQEPFAPPGGFKHIGVLLAYEGSNCVLLPLPGGGAYKVCG